MKEGLKVERKDRRKVWRFEGGKKGLKEGRFEGRKEGRLEGKEGREV